MSRLVKFLVSKVGELLKGHRRNPAGRRCSQLTRAREFGKWLYAANLGQRVLIRVGE
jgi:hypothetical protein